MRAIHQIVAGFANGDAISNEARTMRALFRSWGCESQIYSERRRILPELRGEARDLETSRGDFRPQDAVLLHLSIGSDVNDVFPTLPGRKAIRSLSRNLSGTRIPTSVATTAAGRPTSATSRRAHG